MKFKLALKRISSFFIMATMMTLVTKCSTANSPMEMTESNLNGLLPTVQSQEINTIPSPNLPTLTSTATIINEPILTKTPFPTIIADLHTTQEEKENLLMNLMQNNDDCRLPCWWGISLDDELDDVEREIVSQEIGLWEVFSPKSGKGDKIGRYRTGYFNSDTSAYDVSTTVDFHTVDGVIQFIDILAERPVVQYGKEEFVRDWKAFSLSQVLLENGAPSFVYLFQQVADPGSPNYEIVLYYPELGFRFSYHPHETEFEDSKPELCLQLENMRQINVSLYNPEVSELWNPFLPPSLNLDADEYFEGFSWEEQTGLDLDSFYNMFKDTAIPECILIDR